MELSAIYVKFGHAGVDDDSQPSTFDLSMDFGENEPMADVKIQLDLEKNPEATIKELKELSKAKAVEILEEVLSLLKSNTVAELEQAVSDLRAREFAD